MNEEKIKNTLDDIYIKGSTKEHDNMVLTLMREIKKDKNNFCNKMAKLSGIDTDKEKYVSKIEDPKIEDSKKSIVQLLDKIHNVDHNKIDKISDIDYAIGGLLPLPEKGESVNIRIIEKPRYVNDKIFVRCVIYGRETDLQYDLYMSTTIYKGIIAEIRREKIPVDDDLKCIVEHVFTIAGRDWYTAPREMWRFDKMTKKYVPPKIYAVGIRLDLEKQDNLAKDMNQVSKDMVF